MLNAGYNSAGINAVLESADVPKGSFYYYFDSKEDFGLQVVERYYGRINEIMNHYLDDEMCSPLTRLRRCFEVLGERFASRRWRDGCLLGSLGGELSAQNETFRLKFESVFERWRQRITACLQEAQEVGEVPTHLDAHVLADFLLNSWEGALLQMKIRRDATPLESFMVVAFGSVLKV